MGTLQDRLIALADECALAELDMRAGTIGHHDVRRLARAAARMALEEAESRVADGENTRYAAFYTIRALRDGLANV